MSRKLTLGLAAAAMLAAAAFVPGSADANNNRLLVTNTPNHPGHPGHPNLDPRHPRHRGHWVLREHRRVFVYDRPEIETVVTPGPCTCLTKNYTPEGLVVFADLCTKESASALVDGVAAAAIESERPADYAGRTYQDYLAAHPEAAQAQKVPETPQPKEQDSQPKN